MPNFKTIGLWVASTVCKKKDKKKKITKKLSEFLQAENGWGDFLLIWYVHVVPLVHTANLV